MSDISYEIINRCMNGMEITGYTVQDANGNKKTITLTDAIKLARRGVLTNAKSLIDITNGEYLIDVEPDLEVICKNPKLKLVLQCRLLDSTGKCVGYKSVDSTGKRYNLSIKKTWELAFNGNVENVKAIIIGDNKVLISTGEFKLESLPKIQGKG